jgi:hypothetical protein
MVEVGNENTICDPRAQKIGREVRTLDMGDMMRGSKIAESRHCETSCI